MEHQEHDMCINPIKVKTSGDIPVPCGRCTVCRARRISAWSFRLMQEDKKSISSHFITLTYATTKVPITDAGYMALDRRDLQRFFKRLRRATSKKRKIGPGIKYYAAGEYGGKTRRPHYHIILFNADESVIQQSWGLGQCHYGKVSGASVGYTLKYISKPSKIPIHKNDDRPKEFSLMSKGLGVNYLTENMVQWHKGDLENRMYINVGDGKKAAMPRYYKEKLYSEAERQKIAENAIIKQQQRTLDVYNASDGNPDQQRLIQIEHEKWLLLQSIKDRL